MKPEQEKWYVSRSFWCLKCKDGIKRERVNENRVRDEAVALGPFDSKEAAENARKQQRDWRDLYVWYND